MLRLNALPFVLEGLLSKLEGNHVVPVLGLGLVEEVMGAASGLLYKMDCTASFPNSHLDLSA